MAGKHSKGFFDFKKNPLVTQTDRPNKKAMSLPFKIIISVLVLSLVVSTFFLGRFFTQSSSHKKMQQNAREIFSSMESSQAINKLAQENSDIKGWLKIEGTEINDAVCQEKTDGFYSDHNQLGKKSRYGALHLSASESFDRKGGDANIAIWGNNMKDDTMFGSLQEYCNLHFYKKHPFAELYYGDKHETYAIFAVMLLPATDEGNYRVTSSRFSNRSEFDEWYNETLHRSFLHTGVDVQYGDEFLTLITAAKDFEGARLAVIAKKTDSADIGSINLSKARANADIKHPKAWYLERELNYPY